MVGHSGLPPFIYYRTNLIKEQRILYEFYGKMGIMTDRERRKRMHAAGELRSSWLSSARGAGGKLPPAKSGQLAVIRI